MGDGGRGSDFVQHCPRLLVAFEDTEIGVFEVGGSFRA
jgi:hypothetical protein